MFTRIWYTKPPHLCNDVAVSILVHGKGSNDYFVVNVLWQEDPVKYHVEGHPKILDLWPPTWTWTHIDED